MQSKRNLGRFSALVLRCVEPFSQCPVVTRYDKHAHAATKVASSQQRSIMVVRFRIACTDWLRGHGTSHDVGGQVVVGIAITAVVFALAMAIFR